MIQYDPNDALACYPEGQYMATLQNAEETTSKAGNPMYKLEWKVYGPGEASMTLFDYILMDGKMTWKLKRLADALGQSDAFKARKFDPAAWCGHNITLDLDVRDDPKYGEQNQIRNYIARDTATIPMALPKTKQTVAEKFEAEDADLPF